MERYWSRLDNNGNLYPAVLSKHHTTLFRLSLVLTSPVNADRLNRALETIMQRFPYYRVHLRRGAFWYTFVENQRTPKAVIDSRYPCTYMPIKQRGVFPFRVRAWGKTVSVEFSHSLTDGTGAIIFLKSLIAAYYLSGLTGGSPEYENALTEFGRDGQIFLFNEEMDQEEAEDAFRKYFDSDIPDPEAEKKVFHLPGKRIISSHYRVITAEMDIEPVLNESRRLGISLTEYLTSVYFFALQKIQLSHMGKRSRKRWKALSVMVPVNLRTLLPSRTMRNFFLTLNPQLDTRLGFYDFEEICSKVHHFLRSQLDYRQLKQHIRRNMRGVVHPLLRIAPLFIKNRVIRMVYRDHGENRFSGSLSNLGSFTLPGPLEAMVKRVYFIPPPSPVLGVKCGVISYGDKLYISFGSLIEEREFEYRCITFLRKAGIRIRLLGNWKGEKDALLSTLRG
jgi:hypothetical protein